MRAGHRCSVYDGLAKLVMGHERTYVLQNYIHKYICKYIITNTFANIFTNILRNIFTNTFTNRFIDIFTNIFANLFAKSMVGDILFAQICLQPPDVNIDTIALVSNIEKVNGIVLNKSENFF